MIHNGTSGRSLALAGVAALALLATLVIALMPFLLPAR